MLQDSEAFGRVSRSSVLSNLQANPEGLTFILDEDEMTIASVVSLRYATSLAASLEMACRNGKTNGGFRG